jgi:heme/copper-type cytochrome/quinol oxidase subunit 2
MSKPGYSDQGFWFRLIFMLVYWVVLNIFITVFGILLVIVSVIKLGSKHEAVTLSVWLKNVTTFIQQIFLFLSFEEDEKPFPFQPWPQVDADEES